MHVIGGFAVTVHYALQRPTGDIDVFEVIPRHLVGWVTSLAGRNSALHVKHKVYLQIAAVAVPPEAYASRLTEAFTGEFANLRLFVMDPYDLALTKLSRNSDVDMEDVKHLARSLSFDEETLRNRYRQELRPFLHGPVERHDQTLDLWIETMREDRNRAPR